MILDEPPHIPGEDFQRAQQIAKARKEIHSIPLSVAENSAAFLIPDKVGDLSQKDRARLIYALGQNLIVLQRQAQQLDQIAGYLNHQLIMLTTPVSEQ